MPYMTCPLCMCREPQREGEVRCEHLTQMIKWFRSGELNAVEAFDKLLAMARDVENNTRMNR